MYHENISPEQVEELQSYFQDLWNDFKKNKYIKRVARYSRMFFVSCLLIVVLLYLVGILGLLYSIKHEKGKGEINFYSLATLFNSILIFITTYLIIK